MRPLQARPAHRHGPPETFIVLAILLLLLLLQCCLPLTASPLPLTFLQLQRLPASEVRSQCTPRALAPIPLPPEEGTTWWRFFNLFTLLCLFPLPPSHDTFRSRHSTKTSASFIPLHPTFLQSFLIIIGSLFIPSITTPQLPPQCKPHLGRNPSRSDIASASSSPPTSPPSSSFFSSASLPTYPCRIPISPLPPPPPPLPPRGWPAASSAPLRKPSTPWPSLPPGKNSAGDSSPGTENACAPCPWRVRRAKA